MCVYIICYLLTLVGRPSAIMPVIALRCPCSRWACSLVLSKRRERVAAQKSNFTLFRGCIKRPEVSARMEFDIRWGNRNDTLLRSENVESRPQRYRGFVQVASIDVVPSSRVQAVDERLNGGDRFRRRKGAMPRAVNKRPPQEFSVSFFVDHFLVSALVLNYYQAIALRVEREHWNVNLAIENDIPLEVAHGLGIGADSYGLIQKF